MHVAAIADLHIGNHRRFGGVPVVGINDRCRMTLDALAEAVKRARAKGAKTFLSAGDLFDDAKPSPQILSAVQDILRPAEMDIILLVGNHEQESTAPGDHALGPLREWATVVDKPCVLQRRGGSILCLPYDPRPASEWFGPVVDELMLTGSADLLAVHLGILDDATPPWLRESRDAIPAQTVLARMDTHEIPFGVAGNWHNHGAWGENPERPNLVQCGALVPTGWDNEGLSGYGGLVFFTDAGASADVIPGPRFVKARNLTEFKKTEKRAAKEGLRVYMRFIVSPDEMTSMTAELDLAKTRGVIVDGDAEADAALVTAAARTAAHGARKAETLEEALTSFVREMPLDDDLDRSEVLSLSRGYLGGGA